MLGLALIKQGKRAASTPSTKNDFFVAQSLLCIPDALAHIQRHFLHDECGVVIGVAALTIDNMMSGFGKCHRQREILTAANGMHKNDDGF